MKEVKTAELIGVALDWAVAEAEDVPLSQASWKSQLAHYGGVARTHGGKYSPSTDWSQGGPLVAEHRFDFEWIDCDWHGEPIEHFVATGYDLPVEGIGKTHLIAACRAIVASKLGAEVQIPGELLP